MPDELQPPEFELPADVISALESEVSPDLASVTGGEATSPPAPALTGLLALPAQGIPVTADYSLNLRVNPALSLVTITVAGLLLLPNGTLLSLVFPQPITSGGGTQQDFSFPLTEGRLLSVAVSTADSGVRRGFCFAQVWLQAGQVPGSTPLVQLIADYIQSYRPCAWPPARLSYFEDGEVEVIRGSSGGPPAGSEFTFTTALNVQAEVYAFEATLVTSAAAGTRAVSLQHIDGATEMGRFPAEATQGPGSTVIYVGGLLGGAASAVPGVTRIPIPPRYRMARNSSLNSVTANLAAGDQWGSIAFWHALRPDF